MAAMKAMGRNMPAIVPIQKASVRTPNIFAVNIMGFLFRKHFKFANVITSVLYGI